MNVPLTFEGNTLPLNVRISEEHREVRPCVPQLSNVYITQALSILLKYVELRVCVPFVTKKPCQHHHHLELWSSPHHARTKYYSFEK